MPLDKHPTKMYPGFGLSMLDRAVKEYFAERCSSADLSRIREYFLREGAVHCVYCDRENPNRWDHIHPVSRGGDTVPGNLAPACGRCDDSKQDKTVTEWANGNGKHRPKGEQVSKILTRIESYQRAFGYSPREFEDKLTSDNLATYRRIRERWEALRNLLKEEGVTK